MLRPVAHGLTRAVCLLTVTRRGSHLPALIVCCARPKEQLFDWQNAVFLLFFPLMLLISTLIFRQTFKALGAKDLGEVMDNVGELHHDTPMPYYPQQQRPTPALVPVPMIPVVAAPAAAGGASGEGNREIYARPMEAGSVNVHSVTFFARSRQDGQMPSTYAWETGMPHRPAGQMLSGFAFGYNARHDFVASTAIDRRNISVMISIGGFIYSIGLIGWASIADFALPGSEAETFAQGLATQGIRQGVEQVCRHACARTHARTDLERRREEGAAATTCAVVVRAGRF
jgi:hypothetical protein